MLQMFLVGVIYICSSNLLYCGDNPVKTKKFRVVQGTDPKIIRDECNKWVADTSWDMSLNKGKVIMSDCKLMLLKE